MTQTNKKIPWRIWEVKKDKKKKTYQRRRSGVSKITVAVDVLLVYTFKLSEWKLLNG